MMCLKYTTYSIGKINVVSYIFTFNQFHTSDTAFLFSIIQHNTDLFLTICQHGKLCVDAPARTNCCLSTLQRQFRQCDFSIVYRV